MSHPRADFLPAFIVIAVLAVAPIFAADHPESLERQEKSAKALLAKGQWAAAEKEYRALVAAKERTVGNEHRDTLESRMNLAAALLGQRKNAEAREEFRAVTEIEDRAGGAEKQTPFHNLKLLGAAVATLGKHAEIEKEYRTVLAIQERLHGAEHETVFFACRVLAECLEDQCNLKEALPLAQRAERGYLKTHGAKDHHAIAATDLRDRIEAKFKKQQPEAPGK